MSAYSYSAPLVTTTARLSASDLAYRLFMLDVGFVLARAVLPTLIDLVTHGRPAPTVPIPQEGLARAVSAGCSLATVVVAALAIGLLRPSMQRLRPLALAWLGYVVLELAIALHRGGWALSTSFVTLCALGTVIWLEVELDRVLQGVVRLIASVGVISLLMAVVWPSAAKYGDVSAGWFTRDARLAGPFSTPNEESNVFALGVVLWLGGWREGDQRWPTLRSWVQFALLLLPLLLSQSYTAWAAVVVGAFVVVLGPRRNRTWRVSPIAVVALPVLAFFVPRLLAYLDTQQSPAGFSGRKLVWALVHEHWREAFLVGHGPGVWRSLIAQSAVPPWAVNAHSELLDSLYTTGVVGTGVLLLVLVGMTVRAFRVWRAGGPVVLACLGVELVRSYTEVPFQVLFGGLNLFVVLVLLGLLARGVATVTPTGDQLPSGWWRGQA